MTIYESLRDAGAEIDHRESDLYVKYSREVVTLLKQYSGLKNVRAFVSQIDGAIWYDVPFAYDPYWKNITKGATA